MTAQEIMSVEKEERLLLACSTDSPIARRGFREMAHEKQLAARDYRSTHSICATLVYKFSCAFRFNSVNGTTPFPLT